MTPSDSRPGSTLGLAGRWAYLTILLLLVAGGIVLWFRYGTAVAPLVGGTP